MAAHLYWRVNVTANNGETQYLGVPELEFRAIAGGTTQTTGGTASASSSAAVNEPALAFDGDDTTYWYTAYLDVTGWLAYAFASPVAVAEVAIGSFDAAIATAARLNRMPRDFDIQWSDDGTTWTNALSVTGETNWVADETRTFSLLPPSAHSYWRVYCSLNNGSNSYTSAGEIEFRESVGGVDAATGGTVTASSVYTSNAFYAAENAFDDTPSTGWLSGAGDTQGWIQYEFPAPVDIAEVAFSATPMAGQQDATPRDFHIRWSDDGVIWTTHASILNQTAWTSGETRIYALASYPPVEGTARLTATGLQVLDAGGTPAARLTATGLQVLDAGGTPAARLTATGLQVLALDPQYVPVPGTCTLYITSDNTNAQGLNVYHATAPMDVLSLPAPLAVIGPDATSYAHVGLFLPDAPQYYRVGAYNVDGEAVSAEVTLNATDNAFVGEVPYSRPTATLALVVDNTSHGATTNTKQALLDAGFQDANISVVLDETDPLPDVRAIVVCRAGSTLAELQPTLNAWAAGTPIVLGPGAGFNAGTGYSLPPTFANLTGTWQAEAPATGATDDNTLTSNSHPITSPYALGPRVLWSGDNYGIVLDSGAAFVGVALANGDSDSAALSANPTLIAVEAGTNDLLGNPTPARSVVWGDLYGGQAPYNANGAALLGRIIDWACQPVTTFQSGTFEEGTFQ